MKLLGLTGNIACGKSTVAGLLQARGAAVLDADALVHELYSDTEFSRRVAALFDSPVLTPFGVVDRARLSTLVFADAAALRRLESLVHPAVAALRAEKLRTFQNRPQPPDVVVLEAVKLIESGQARGCEAVWCVVCDFEVQLRRLMEARGLAEESARARLQAQPPLAEKQRLLAELNVPLVFLKNNGSLAALEAAVERHWQELEHQDFQRVESKPLSSSAV